MQEFEPAANDETKVTQTLFTDSEILTIQEATLSEEELYAPAANDLLTEIFLAELELGMRTPTSSIHWERLRSALVAPLVDFTD